MTGHLRHPWLPGLLRRLSLLVAGLLVSLVLVAPLVDNGSERARGLLRFLSLFARDDTVRGSALAAAVGLTVTAFVFFKPSPRSPLDSYVASRGQPPNDVVGA